MPNSISDKIAGDIRARAKAEGFAPERRLANTVLREYNDLRARRRDN
jgi:hypothetical protein